MDVSLHIRETGCCIRAVGPVEGPISLRLHYQSPSLGVVSKSGQLPTSLIRFSEIEYYLVGSRVRAGPVKGPGFLHYQ